jgi:hypothetical protein
VGGKLIAAQADFSLFSRPYFGAINFDGLTHICDKT